MDPPLPLDDPCLTDHDCDSSQDNLLQELKRPGSSNFYHQQHSWLAPPFQLNSRHSEIYSPMQGTRLVASSGVKSERCTPALPEPDVGNYGILEPSVSQHRSPVYVSHSSFAHQNTRSARLSHSSLGMDRPVVLATPQLDNDHRDESSRRTRNQSSTGNYVKSEPAPDGMEAKSLSMLPDNTAKKTSNNRQKRRRPGKPSRKPTAREEHLNCYGEEVPPALKDQCPDEERTIFDSRWHHRDKRGHDMWNKIQADFAKIFNRNHSKEMLQMKFRRARAKYIQWLQKDEEILRDAWEKTERERYERILDRFFKLGGSRDLRINASDIEVKLVNDPQLEEGLYLDCLQSSGMECAAEEKWPRENARGEIGQETWRRQSRQI